MTLSRILKREGKKLVFTVDGSSLKLEGASPRAATEKFPSRVDAAERLVELTRTKLEQGWSPTSKPEDVGTFVKALEDAGLGTWRYIVALTDDEVNRFYDKVIRGKDPDISLDVLRRRPTRALFAWMLTRFDDYYMEEWTKAVKFLAKVPAHAMWINEELLASLDTGALPSDRAKQFATRNAKKIAAGPKPAPKAPSTATGNEKDLLTLIANRPNDDAPRLVYADWLLEQGNGFGEFIQTSCKIALLEYGASGFDELSTQLKKLENKFAKGWLEPIRPFIRSWSFERGLLSRVVSDAALFTQAADAIALRGPRAYIELTGLKKKDITALANAPLGAFGHVNLDQQRIDDAGMAAIAKSHTIAGATSWGLGYNAFKDDGLRAIAASPHFASAEQLTLRSFEVQFTASGLAALFASPNLPRLRDLELSASSVGGAFARCHLALGSLSLAVEKFTREDAEALVRGFPALEHLTINQQGNTALAFGDDDVNAILDALPKLASFSTNVDIRKATQARIDALA